MATLKRYPALRDRLPLQSVYAVPSHLRESVRRAVCSELVVVAEPGFRVDAAYRYEVPSSPEVVRDQFELFGAMNYARWRVARVLSAVGRQPIPGRLLAELAPWAETANRVRDFLIVESGGLVLSMLRQYRHPPSFRETLRDVGELALIRSVDVFDRTRGNRFSTLACAAIFRDFLGATRRDRSSPLPMLESDGGAEERDPDVAIHLADVLASVRLTKRERTVLRYRYGLDGKPPMTLAELGEKLGLCAQRVHQIEAEVLAKLRGE